VWGTFDNNSVRVVEYDRKGNALYETPSQISMLIRVLSIYPCSCLVDDIVANDGQGIFDVTCMSYSDFNSGVYGDYENLSRDYDVIILDGADCWNSGANLDVEERENLREFVRRGGGFITTHDTICHKGWPEIQEILGYDCSAPGTIGMSSVARTRRDGITIFPYSLPSSMSIQSTHTTGNQNPINATRWYEVTADDSGYDVYLATHQYAAGKTAMLQWGHWAYSCDCSLRDGAPAAGSDESHLIINTLYWVARKKGEVSWIINGTTPSESRRYYYVYFDTLENGVKNPVSNITSYVSTGEYEAFGLWYAPGCSDDLYVLENSVNKFFISIPPVYNCSEVTDIENHYAGLPMRIWTKGSDSSTYRKNGSIIDQTTFLIYNGTAWYNLVTSSIAQIKAYGSKIIVYPDNTVLDLDLQVTYQMYPNSNWVSVTLAAKNVGTSSKNVKFNWTGDQDPPKINWRDGDGKSCGGCKGNRGIGLISKWAAGMLCDYDDLIGYIIEPTQTLFIHNETTDGTCSGYAGPKLGETSATTIAPGETHEMRFWIVSDFQGPAGEEWKPVEDAYEAIASLIAGPILITQRNPELG
jgi:hypothetical protein